MSERGEEPGHCVRMQKTDVSFACIVIVNQLLLLFKKTISVYIRINVLPVSQVQELP